MGGSHVAVCPLCAQAGGEILWRDAHMRIVLADEPDWPGFCRVIWNDHVAEMTGLADHDRGRLMRAVFAIEAVLRDCLTPDKINLASLGNLVPHLHWHVIPRWRDDSHFPGPIWAAPLRKRPDRRLPADLGSRLGSALGSALHSSIDVDRDRETPRA